MAINIGIDLGTTNSCISYLEGNEPLIVPNPEGTRVIPSIVALNSENKRIFGNIAKRQFITNNKNTIWGIKRLMGRKYESPEISRIHQRISYNITTAENGDIRVQLGDRFYSPEEISSMLLDYFKEITEDYLGEPIADTVITVPAFFNDAQRQATKVAGQIAHLNVSRIINEPTAALIAYRDRINKDGLYAVYDLGGGTFDISIIEVKRDVYKVVSTTGDTFLGGNDFDEKIIEWIISEIQKDLENDVSDDKNALQRIIQEAEKVKIELSFNREGIISIPYLIHLPDGTNYHFKRVLSRSQLESFVEVYIAKTIELIKRSMEEINILPQDIERTILVGGQSRMPLIFKRISEFFKKDPFIDLNPEEVVAQGAAIQAEIIKGKVKDLLLLDVTPLSLGVETKGDVFTKIIEKNATVPIKKSMIFTTIEDNQHTVSIHVLQGEREVASKNKSLGFFNLIGIAPAPKGMPQIEVSFEIDVNGIVKVSATDKQTGLSQGIKIESASGLSPEEIDKMIEEARRYKEQDKVTVRVNEIKNDLSQEYNQSKSFLKKFDKRLSAHERNEFIALLDKIDKAMKGDDIRLLENLFLKIRDFRIKMNKALISEFSK